MWLMTCLTNLRIISEICLRECLVGFLVNRKKRRLMTLLKNWRQWGFWVNGVLGEAIEYSYRCN